MELIKNARRSNLALVVASTAVLALALAPTSTVSIEAAISEILLLKSLDHETLAEHLETVGVMHEFDEPAGVRLLALLYELSVENGGSLSLSPDLQINVEAASDYRDDTLMQLRLRDPPYDRKTVQDWFDYFDNPATFWFFPDKTIMQDAILSAIPLWCESCPLSSVVFEKSFGVLFNANLYFEDEGHIAIGRIQCLGIVQETLGTFDLHTLVLNAGKRRQYSQLVPSEGSLLALRHYRSQIADLTLDEATKALHNEVASTSPKLEVFGLSVDQRAAVLVAPSLVIMLLLYILAHVRELASSLSKRKEVGWDASWIALFGNWLALVITFMSLCIFPVFACSLLLARVRWTLSGYYDLAAISLIVGAAALGIWCVFALRAVRRSMLPSGPKA